MSLVKPLKVCESCGREFWSEADLLDRTSRWRICERKNLWFNCSCESTNFIPKGQYAWYHPEDKLSSEAASLFNSLATVEQLPNIPSYINELQQAACRPNASAAKLAKLVRKTPILAASVLDLANSKCREEKIETLELAIAYIGLDSFQEMVQLAEIKTWQTPCRHFSREDFWSSSLLTGEISEFLAKRFVPEFNHDEAYIAGSMLNLGKIAYAMVEPHATDEIAREVDNLSTLDTWCEVERKRNAPSHVALGEIVASFWGFPDFVIESIMRHHRPAPHAKPRKITISELAGFANQICHWVTLKPHRIDEDLIHAYCIQLGISEKELQDLTSEFMDIKRQSA